MQAVIIEKTPVYLTDEECQQFIKFQKHRALIGLLDSIGFFTLKSGSIQIHIDSNGKIAGVEKMEHYRV